MGKPKKQINAKLGKTATLKKKADAPSIQDPIPIPKKKAAKVLVKAKNRGKAPKSNKKIKKLPKSPKAYDAKKTKKPSKSKDATTSKTSSPEEAIKAEDKQVRLNFIKDQLNKMEETVTQIELSLAEYAQVTDFTEVFIHIDRQRFSIDSMKEIMANPKSPALDKFKKDGAVDEDKATDEYIKDKMKAMGKAVKQTEAALTVVDYLSDFSITYKLLDVQQKNLKSLAAGIKDPSKIPKRSVLSATAKKNTSKTLVKSSAAKSENAPLKDSVATLIKQYIVELGNARLERPAIIHLFDLFDGEGRKINLAPDVVESMLKACEKQLQNEKKFMRSNAASLLEFITRQKQYLPFVLKSNVIKLLVPLLGQKEEDLVVPAMNNLGYIAELDSEAGARAVIDAGVLKHLKFAFMMGDEDVSSKAIWLLRHLCNGDYINKKDQNPLQDIFDEKLHVPLVNHLDASDRPARVDAFYAINGLLTYSNDEQALMIVDAGAISDLCNFFGEYDNYDITLTALNTLTDILSKSGKRAKEVADDIQGSGGYDILSDLQEDEDEFISEGAKFILEEYFK